MKVFDTSGQFLQTVATDAATSNALSVLSQAVSVLSQGISVVSQAVSVLSQATSVAQAALSVRIDTQSQSVSVLSQQISALSQGVSVISQALSVETANRVSAANALSQSISVLSQAISVISNRVSALGVPVGQCYLSVKSPSSVVLAPYNGQQIQIQGNRYLVPSGGVDLAIGALTSSTSYNIYAFVSAVSVVTLEATVSAHATDTTAGNIGVEIKSGDASRTLVGKVRTNAAIQFVDTVSQRFLINWFNRRRRNGFNGFTANRTTSSQRPTFAELNTEIRIEFLTWADEIVPCSATLIVANNTLSGVSDTSVGFDGTTAEDIVLWTEIGANFNEQGGALWFSKTGLAEGYHYATLLGAVVSGVQTGTWFGTGAGAGALRCTLHLEIMG